MKRLCRLAVICIFMLFCEMVVPVSVHAAETMELLSLQW